MLVAVECHCHACWRTESKLKLKFVLGLLGSKGSDKLGPEKIVRSLTWSKMAGDLRERTFRGRSELFVRGVHCGHVTDMTLGKTKVLFFCVGIRLLAAWDNILGSRDWFSVLVSPSWLYGGDVGNA